MDTVPTGYGVNSHSTRPKVCRTCGKPPAKGQRISFRGYCRDCAAKAVGEAGRQIQAKEGPYYEQWLRSSIEANARLQAELDSLTR